MGEAWEALGFGFAEIGSVTAKPCMGNAKPRLWRLPEKKSIIVNYGLANDGADAIYARIPRTTFPLGISIAPTNSQEIATVSDAIADVCFTYMKFLDKASYYTLNISCPNTHGPRWFLDPDNLALLLNDLEKLPHIRPLFIKLSANLPDKILDTLVALASQYQIDGFVCTNLGDNNPTIYPGGVSGGLLRARSNEILARIYQKTRGTVPLIGVGGVFSAQDAYEKICLGASAVQCITGMIYEGPSFVRDVSKNLVKILQRDGYANLSEAVGSQNTLK